MDGHVAAVDRPIYHFHIPKTGGRTVKKFLSSLVDENAVLDPRRNRALHSDLFLRRKNVDHRVVDPASPAKPHVVGHFASFSFIERCPDAYLKVCFWRHPADWMLSFYNHRQYRNRHTFVRPYGFETFCRSMLRNGMTEHLLLHCGDVSGLRYFFMSDRAKFLSALRMIERFDRFQDIAEVDGFLAGLRGEDEAKPEDYNRIKLSAKIVPSLDAATRERIAAANAIDAFLHRIALGEDRARVRQEALRTLSAAFQWADVWRLLRLPAYRMAIWVLPRWRFTGWPRSATSALGRHP